MFSFKEKEKINKTIQGVVDSQIFQRLNHIKQLGNLYRIFPGVTHTRFLHSLGVFHLAKITLSENKFIKWSLKEAILFLFASLLHDIGHGPLSHSFEEFVDFSDKTQMKWHEKNTCQIIKYDKDLNRVLKNFSWLKDSLIILFENKFNEEQINDNGINYKKVKQMISSQFDVDRLDYLYRDVYFAGTKYIFGEGELLLKNVKFNEMEGLVHFDKRWEGTIQYYLHTRFHLHEVLYGHEESSLYDAFLYFIGHLIKKLELTTSLKPYLKNVVNYHKDFLSFVDATFELELTRIYNSISKKRNIDSHERLLLVLIKAFIYRNHNFNIHINVKPKGKVQNYFFTNNSFQLFYLLKPSLWYNKNVNPIMIGDDERLWKKDPIYKKDLKILVIKGKL